MTNITPPLQSAGRGGSADGGVPCPACGYDLPATPGRCPECGTAAGDGGAF